MFIRIDLTEQTGSREAGRLSLHDGAIRVERATPEDRRLLENILKDPTLVREGDHSVWIHARREPPRFLERLCQEYTGSYLRALQLEQ